MLCDVSCMSHQSSKVSEWNIQWAFDASTFMYQESSPEVPQISAKTIVIMDEICSHWSNGLLNTSRHRYCRHILAEANAALTCFSWLRLCHSLSDATQHHVQCGSYRLDTCQPTMQTKFPAYTASLKLLQCQMTVTKRTHLHSKTSATIPRVSLKFTIAERADMLHKAVIRLAYVRRTAQIKMLSSSILI